MVEVVGWLVLVEEIVGWLCWLVGSLVKLID